MIPEQNTLHPIISPFFADVGPKALLVLSDLDINVCAEDQFADLSSDLFEQAEADNKACLTCISKGEFEKAIAHGQAALRRLPFWFEPHHNIGYALAYNGQIDKAIPYLEACLEIYPYYDPAHYNLIKALMDLDRLPEALGACLDFETYFPGTADNLFKIGSLYLRSGDRVQASRYFDKALNSRIGQKVSRMLPFGQVTYPKLLHDLKQIERLLRREILPPRFEFVAQEYRRLIDAAPHPKADERWSGKQDFQPCTENLSKIAPFYRRMIHISPCPRLENDVIRSAIDYEGVALAYEEKKPFQFQIIDDFLTPQALKALNTYLLDSTIWHNDAQEGRSYIGAYRDMGVRCPLIDQIIDELTHKFETVIAGAPLEEIWAYRQIVGVNAVGAHADFSKINFNLWLTPDSSNRDPNSGGLTIYKAAAPENWSFEDYNDDYQNIDQYIADAEKIYIPYRENRMVIFDPRLFHASAATHFGEEIEDWRVNLTFLFGER